MTTGEAIKYLELYVGNDCYTIKMQTACQMAITALHAQQEAEQQGPCSRCGYGGEHPEAPPCTSCPAYPKEIEENAPLTPDKLREMDGEPVWCVELQCWGIVKVETVGPRANELFLVGAWRAPTCGRALNFECDVDMRGLTLYRRKPEGELT